MIPQRFFLPPTTASQYIKSLGLSATPRTLSKLRSRGGGPEYRKFGRHVVYDIESINAWISKRLSQQMTSTSD